MPAGSTRKEPNKKYKRKMAKKGTPASKKVTPAAPKPSAPAPAAPTPKPAAPPAAPKPPAPPAATPKPAAPAPAATTKPVAPKPPAPPAATTKPVAPKPPAPPAATTKPVAPKPPAPPAATTKPVAPKPPAPPAATPKPAAAIPKPTAPTATPQLSTSVSAETPEGRVYKLPAPKPPLVARDAPWCIFGRSSGKGELTMRNDALRVEYKEGLVGSISGVTFHAKPDGFPCTDATLHYQVFFNDHFDFREGGKLPGLYIGGVGASGGNWSDDCGSARVVFKQGGAAVSYVYVPLQVCGGKDDRDALDKVQGSQFANAVQHTNKGTHVWRDGSAGDFKRGAWNDVSIRVKLNEGNKKNGLLEMCINQKRSSMPIVWRTNPALKVTGIAFATFFGGSAKSASAPPNAFAEFRNFTYSIK